VITNEKAENIYDPKDYVTVHRTYFDKLRRRMHGEWRWTASGKPVTSEEIGEACRLQRKVTLDYVSDVCGAVPFNDEAVPLVVERPT
jgi:hypothetical protein